MPAIAARVRLCGLQNADQNGKTGVYRGNGLVRLDDGGLVSVKLSNMILCKTFPSRSRTPPCNRRTRIESETPPRVLSQHASSNGSDISVSLLAGQRIGQSVMLSGRKLYSLHKQMNIKTLHPSFKFIDSTVIGQTRPCWRSDNVERVVPGGPKPAWLMLVQRECERSGWQLTVDWDLGEALSTLQARRPSAELLILMLPPPVCPIHKRRHVLRTSHTATNPDRKFWACPQSDEHPSDSPPPWKFQWCDEARMGSLEPLSYAGPARSQDIPSTHLGLGRMGLDKWVEAIGHAGSDIRVASFSM
jgi:hypothetical protein